MTSTLLLGVASLTGGCGGGGGDTQSVPQEPSGRIEGRIFITPYTDVDGTVNDPDAAFSDNETFATAQPLNNPAIVGGYVTAAPTGRPGDRFEDRDNRFDTYLITLSAGQHLTLYVSDFATGTAEIDLLLRDADTVGPDGLPPVVDSSVGPFAVQQVTAPRDGRYYVDLQAFTGASKYVLNTTTAGTLRQMGHPEPLRVHAEKRPGEVMVTLRRPSAGAGGADATIAGMARSMGMRQVGGTGRGPYLLRADRTLNSGDVLARMGLAPAAAPRSARQPEHDARLVSDEAVALARGLVRHPDVARATPNYLYRVQVLPDDPLFDLQWHLKQVDLPAAWEIRSAAPQTTLAVLDSGIFLDHPDLAPGLTTDGTSGDGWNFVEWPSGTGPNPDDPGDGVLPGSSSWHGTHVAGIAAAAANNARGVSGTSWDLSLMPVRVCGQGGACSEYDVQQGLRYAAGLPNDSGTVPASPADVINLSFGGPTATQESAELVATLCERGILLVAAAGNAGTATPYYPASYPCVFSVGAVEAAGELAWYSNTGATVDLFAPGGDMSADLTGDGYADGILSTYVDDLSGTREPAYAFQQGTSMAAPMVAGVFALMRDLDPQLTPALMRSWLESGELTAPAPGTEAGTRDPELGFGVLDPVAALERAAASGGVPATPVVLASPSLLAFSEGIQELSFTLSASAGDLAVAAVGDDAEWLEVLPLDVDERGLGTYRARVDSEALVPGRYLARIEATADTGAVTRIDVTLSIADPTLAGPADAGRHYVRLIDAGDLATRYEAVAAAIEGGYRFSIAVAPGTYYVLAGTDLDNDGAVCVAGEACGSFPNTDQLDVVEITAEETRALEFVTGFRTEIGTAVDELTPDD